MGGVLRGHSQRLTASVCVTPNPGGLAGASAPPKASLRRSSETAPPPRSTQPRPLPSHSHCEVRSTLHRIRGGATVAQALWAAEVATGEEGKGPAAPSEGHRAPPPAPPPCPPPRESCGHPHVQPSPGSSLPRPLPGSGQAAAFLCRRDGARPGRYAGGKRGLLKSLRSGL